MASRKDIRLKPANYVGLRTYFITLCCQKRARAFSNPATAARAVDILRDSANLKRFAIHAYCFMPDHAHVLAEGTDPESCLSEFVADFKHKTGHELQSRAHQVFWQTKFYDHILRKRDSQDAIAWYVWMNPVRKGITGDPWEYPFSGSFTMDWKNRLRPPTEWTPPWKTPRSGRE